MTNCWWKLLIAASFIAAAPGPSAGQAVTSRRSVPSYRVGPPCDTVYSARTWPDSRLPFIVAAATDSLGRTVFVDARALGVRMVSQYGTLDTVQREPLDFGRPLVGASVFRSGKGQFVITLLGLRAVIVNEDGRVLRRYALRPTDRSAGSAVTAGPIGGRGALAVTTAKLESEGSQAYRRVSTLRIFDTTGKEVDVAPTVKGAAFRATTESREGRINGHVPTRRVTAVTSLNRIFQLDEVAGVVRVFNARLILTDSISLAGSWDSNNARAREPWAMVADGAGNAWIEIPARAPNERSWLIVNGGTRFVIPGVTPAGESVLAIADGRIILARGDDLGTRSVRVCNVTLDQ